jgi:hypothetical protein
MKSPKPYSKGRVVMYVPTEEDIKAAGGNNTTPWPATIVQTWEDTGYQNDEVNLKVLTDAPNDLWKTSVPFDEGEVLGENTFRPPSPGSWHWPEIK